MITVVKLGGSLLGTSVLPACLQMAVSLQGRIVIVPGGGVFADLVRSEQRRWQFGDITAHRMAILAMQQMALLCHSLQPSLSLCCRTDEFALRAENSIWLPDWQELDQAGVSASWDITSDSLAAWLAGRLNAGRLMLIKAAEIEPSASLLELQQQGILDPAFLRFADPQCYAITVINQQRFLSAT